MPPTATGMRQTLPSTKSPNTANAAPRAACHVCDGADIPGVSFVIRPLQGNLISRVPNSARQRRLAFNGRRRANPECAFQQGSWPSRAAKSLRHGGTGRQGASKSPRRSSDALFNSRRSNGEGAAIRGFFSHHFNDAPSEAFEALASRGLQLWAAICSPAEACPHAYRGFRSGRRSAH